MSTHVLSLLVEDKPGLLTRVAALFARRGFNIDSLAVGRTEVPGLSRITVVVDVDQLPLEQVTKQLNKLVNVVKIVELEPGQSVQREHMLIKVKVDNSTRSQILEAATLFRARVVDVTTDALVIEVTGDSPKCQALLRLLEPYGVKEIAGHRARRHVQQRARADGRRPLSRPARGRLAARAARRSGTAPDRHPTPRTRVRNASEPKIHEEERP